MGTHILGIDHIGIAVADLDAAIALYTTLFGSPPASIEDVADQRVRTAFFPAGGSSIELLYPTADDSPISKFLQRRGDGIHHICLAVSNLEQALDELRAQGMRLIDAEPRRGAHGKRIAFLHPKSTGGVLLELSEEVTACAPRREPHEGPPAAEPGSE